MSDVPSLLRSLRLDDQDLDPEITLGDLDLSELDLCVTPSSSPDWWDIGKKRRARALLQQTEDEQRHSARLCGEENGLKQMFKNAPRFNGDVSRWKGDATTSEQENMFEGAGSFNTKWKCKTEFDGPTETCKERHESEIREEISEIRQFFRSS